MHNAPTQCTMRAALYQLERATRGACTLELQAQAQAPAPAQSKFKFERRIWSYVHCEPVHFALTEDGAPPLFLKLFVSSLESVLRDLMSKAKDSRHAAAHAAACVSTGRVDASVLSALATEAICHKKPLLACALVASCSAVGSADVEMCLSQMVGAFAPLALKDHCALLSALLRRLRELDVRTTFGLQVTSKIFRDDTLDYVWTRTSDGTHLFCVLLERVVLTSSQLQHLANKASLPFFASNLALSALLEVAKHPHARTDIQSLLVSFFMNIHEFFNVHFEGARNLLTQLMDTCPGLDVASLPEAADSAMLARALVLFMCFKLPDSPKKLVFLQRAFCWLIKLGADHNAAARYVFQTKANIDPAITKILLEHERTTGATRELLKWHKAQFLNH